MDCLTQVEQIKTDFIRCRELLMVIGNETARMSHKLKRKLSADSHGKIITTLVLGYPAVEYRRMAAQRERSTIQYD